PSNYDSPKSMVSYFFFDAFFFFPPFFFVAIMLTTFRAVRDLSVAHPWHRVPNCSGKLTRDCCGGGPCGERSDDLHSLNGSSSYQRSSFLGVNSAIYKTRCQADAK